jgi:hypothetical protein
MNRTGRILAAAVSLAAVASLAVTACSPAPAQAVKGQAAEEKAAVLNWLAKTNAMWTHNDFAALDEITTAEMRTIYLAEKQGASLPANASRQPFQLTGLSIAIPCQAGRPGVFVAYGDTDVFDLGPAMQPMAMVFEPVDGRWKLAAAVNDFFAGSGSVNAQAARQAGQNRRGGVSFTQSFAATANPTLALPLAGSRGFWMIGILTQTGHYASATGLRAKNWPDGNQVATPRPAVVHHETDTFITTYTAIDPPRSAGATLTLDGFFGWPLAAVAS